MDESVEAEIDAIDSKTIHDVLFQDNGIADDDVIEMNEATVNAESSDSEVQKKK